MLLGAGVKHAVHSVSIRDAMSTEVNKDKGIRPIVVIVFSHIELCLAE